MTKIGDSTYRVVTDPDDRARFAPATGTVRLERNGETIWEQEYYSAAERDRAISNMHKRIPGPEDCLDWRLYRDGRAAEYWRGGWSLWLVPCRPDGPSGPVVKTIMVLARDGGAALSVAQQQFPDDGCAGDPVPYTLPTNPSPPALSDIAACGAWGRRGDGTIDFCKWDLRRYWVGPQRTDGVWWSGNEWTDRPFFGRVGQDPEAA